MVPPPSDWKPSGDYAVYPGAHKPTAVREQIPEDVDPERHQTFQETVEHPHEHGLVSPVPPQEFPEDFAHKFPKEFLEKFSDEYVDEFLEELTSWYASQRATTSTSSHKLHIVGEIVARPDHRAQLLRCRLDDDDDEGRYIAKIYDALYHGVNHTWDGDITYAADRDYSCEVTAYEHLRKVGVDGRYTPKYHGSWTFDMPVPEVESGKVDTRSTRAVRMILIEYIPGASMYSHVTTGRVKTIPIPHRLDILAEAMESKCMLYFHGLYHGDFEARNVVVLDTKLDPDASASVASNNPTAGGANNVATKELRRSMRLKSDESTKDEEVRPVAAYSIDFNDSYVVRSPYSKRFVPTRALPTLPTLPNNPIYVFWNSTLDYFGAWVPYAYRTSRPAFNGWLKSRWGSSSERYAAPDWMDMRNERLSQAVVYIPPESINSDDEPSSDEVSD